MLSRTTDSLGPRPLGSASPRRSTSSFVGSCQSLQYYRTVCILCLPLLQQQFNCACATLWMRTVRLGSSSVCAAVFLSCRVCLCLHCQLLLICRIASVALGYPVAAARVILVRPRVRLHGCVDCTHLSVMATQDDCYGSPRSIATGQWSEPRTSGSMVDARTRGINRLLTTK
jgi:hypothetical protein